MYFLVNAPSPNSLAVATSTLQVHWSHDVEGNALCNLDPRSRSNQIFIVNAFPPKPLDIATSNIAGA